MWISSVDENMDSESKLNPQCHNENTCVIVHVMHPIDFRLTLHSALIFSSPDEIQIS